MLKGSEWQLAGGVRDMHDTVYCKCVWVCVCVCVCARSPGCARKCVAACFWILTDSLSLSIVPSYLCFYTVCMSINPYTNMGYMCVLGIQQQCIFSSLHCLHSHAITLECKFPLVYAMCVLHLWMVCVCRKRCLDIQLLLKLHKVKY